MNSQTRADSWREAVLNFMLTVVIGTAIWYEVILRLKRHADWFDPTSPEGAAVTTTIYTIASVVRRYVVRRREGDGQTRAGSLVESCFTTVLFMLAAWLVWVLLVTRLIPPLDLYTDGLLINTSIAACMIPLGYLIRRAFVRIMQ